MPDFSNIISVDLSEAQGFKVESHKAVHQWDSGVILQLTGVELPSGSRAQFDTKTTTYNQDITSGECEIPNALLGYEMTGDIKCHVYIITENYGIVVYDIHIPVIRRPKPDSYIYTDNTSSENGWLKTDNGFKVNEGQSYLGRTTLKVDDNGALLTASQLSLANQGTIINGNSISLASGAASLHAVDGLSLGSGVGSLTENQLSLASGAGTLSSTALSLDSGATTLSSTTLSLNSGAGTLSSTTLSLDSAKATLSGTQLSLNTGRITIGPNKILVDNRWFGSVNLIDPRKLENGGLNTSNGEDQWYSPIHVRTGYIKVNGNTLYTCSKDITTIQLRLRWVCYYDANLRFISYIAPGADAQSYSFTTPDGTAYLRIGFQRISGGTGVDVTVDTFTWAQLEKGSTLSDLVTHSLDCAELTNRCVQDLPSGNLYDWAGYPMQQGGINSDASGTEFASNARVRTDYIPCTQRTTYTFSVSSNAAVFAVRFYTAKGVLSSSTNNTSNSPSMVFTVPDDITYMRFIMVNINGASNNITASSVKNPTLTIGKDIVPYKPYALDNIQLSENTRAISYGQYPYTTTVDLTTIGSRLSIMGAYWKDAPYNLHAAMYCACPNTNNNTAMTFTEFYNWLRNRGPSASGSVLLSVGTKTSSNSQSIPVAAGWYFYSFISHRCGYPTDANSTDNNRRGYIELKGLLPSVHQCYRCKIDDYNGVWRVSYFDQEWRDHNAVGTYNNVTGTPNTISINHEGLVSIYMHITTPSTGLSASTPFATIPVPKNDFTFTLAGSITFNIQNNNGEGRLRNGGQALAGSTGYDLFVTYHTSDENYFYKL